MGLRITPEMIKSFTEDALELCEEVESALLALERMPDAESAGQAFRAFHSIKGNAGFLAMVISRESATWLKTCWTRSGTERRSAIRLPCPSC
jgi:chemotaxis protein histidine kinase CheA